MREARAALAVAGGLAGPAPMAAIGRSGTQVGGSEAHGFAKCSPRVLASDARLAASVWVASPGKPGLAVVFTIMTLLAGIVLLAASAELSLAT